MTLLTYDSAAALPLAPLAPFPSETKEVLAPLSARPPVSTLEQALAMLHEAERVIRSQETRIHDLERMALTDELTGLLNRQGLLLNLGREIARTRRTERTEGLLVLIDLDDFRQINELYGRDVGDTYLQTVGSVLINEIRTTDFAARIGGDEFAVLLPQINAKTAGTRLNALERTLNSRVMHSRQHAIPLRASFGFALLSEIETPDSLFLVADRKLQVSKARRKMGMKS